MPNQNPSNPAYRPRLSIDVSPAQFRALQLHIDWGLKNSLFCALIDGLIPLLEQFGDNLIAAIIRGDISMTKLIDLIGKNNIKEKEDALRRTEE